MRIYLQVSSDLVQERVGAFAENEDVGLLIVGDSCRAPCAILCFIFLVHTTVHRTSSMAHR